MAAWGLLCGLGGAHHSTAVFFAGGMTLAVCWALADAKRLRAWVPLVWLAAGVVPLLSYGTVAYRAFHPGSGEVWPMLEPNLRSVFAHVTASAYRGYLGHWAPDGAQAAWLRWYVYPFLWPGMVLFALQWWNARGARRRVMTGLLVAAVAQTIFVHQSGVFDPDAYFLPCLAVALLAIVPPGAHLLMRLRRTRSGVTFVTAATVVALALFVVPCVNMMARRRRALVIHKSRVTQAWLAEFGDRLKLHFLPAYCPSENHIERLWLDRHANVTRNRRQKTVDALLDRVHGYLAERFDTERRLLLVA
jgi:hypothetical protein